jgi:hypothetical protein
LEGRIISTIAGKDIRYCRDYSVIQKQKNGDNEMTRIVRQPKFSVKQVENGTGFTGGGLYQEMYLDAITNSQWLLTVNDPSLNAAEVVAVYLTLPILIAVDYRYGE